MAFPGHVTPEGVRALAEYRYSAGSYTWLDIKVLGPFWELLAPFIPRLVSPNMLTLAGLLANILATCALLAHNVFLRGDPRTKFPCHCALAASLFFYQTMDGLDGKHARRTGQTTPLGAFFDHGCDCIVMLVICLALELCMATDFSDGVSPYHYMQFVCFLNGNYSFYVSQWGYYHTGVLPTAGCSEAQMIGMFFFVVTGGGASRSFLFDNKPLLLVPSELQGVFPRNADVLQFSGTAISALVVTKTIVDTASTRFRRLNGGGHMAALADMAIGIVPCLVHAAASVALFATDRVLFLENRLLIVLMLGLCMTDLSLRTIISGMCKQPFPLLHLTAAPLLAYAALLACAGRGGASEAGGPTILGAVGGRGAVSHRSCMMAIAAFEATCLLFMFADTIRQVCAFLRIPFLAPVAWPAARKGE